MVKVKQKLKPKGRVVPLSLAVRPRGIIQPETLHRLAAADTAASG